jgi:spermidine dehydrogenase
MRLAEQAAMIAQKNNPIVTLAAAADGITRRDFLDGVAIAIGGAASGALSPRFIATAVAEEAAAQDAAGYYPPTLTGLRGSYPGSFDTAHALRDADFWQHAGAIAATGEDYDLVVVGGGISGLAAGHFYRARRPDARILILDNHDDVGGHAKRNEFALAGRLALMNGGTYAIDSPRPIARLPTAFCARSASILLL